MLLGAAFKNRPTDDRNKRGICVKDNPPSNKRGLDNSMDGVLGRGICSKLSLVHSI